MPSAASYKVCYYPTHFLNQHTESTISFGNYSSLHISQLNEQFIRKKTTNLCFFTILMDALKKYFCLSKFIFITFIKPSDPICKLKQEFFFVMNFQQFFSFTSKVLMENLFILI